MHHFKGFNDWIEIFRGGQQTDSQGRSRTWTAEELDQIVANHNADDPAPAVIGHPKTDDPAYAWTSQLKRVGDKLFAKFREVEPQFEEMVKAGRFKKRSVSIAKNKAGEFMLRHVGWLGAKAPAVEGLAHPSFAADAEEVFEFQVDWRTPSLVGRTLRRIREWIISEHDVDTADKHVPEHLIDEAQYLTDDAKREPDPEDPDFAASFSQHDNGDRTVPKRNDNSTGSEPQTFSQEDVDSAVESAVQAERDKYTAELDKERRARQLHEHQQFVDGLNAPPALAAGMAEFMLELDDGENAQFEFSAGEGDNTEKKKQTPLAWFKAHAEQLKGKFDHLFQEQAGGGNADTVDTGDPEEISKKALEYQKSEAEAGRTISVSQAVQHVTKGAQQ